MKIGCIGTGAMGGAIMRSVCKKFDVNTDLLPLTKSNSKWIPDPKLEHKTIKLLGNSTGET